MECERSVCVIGHHTYLFDHRVECNIHHGVVIHRNEPVALFEFSLTVPGLGYHASMQVICAEGNTKRLVQHHSELSVLAYQWYLQLIAHQGFLQSRPGDIFCLAFP